MEGFSCLPASAFFPVPRCSLSSREEAMKAAARKSYGLLSRGLGDLRDSWASQEQKSRPADQRPQRSVSRRYPAELQVSRRGEELLEVR